VSTRQEMEIEIESRLYIMLLSLCRVEVVLHCMHFVSTRVILDFISRRCAQAVADGDYSCCKLVNCDKEGLALISTVLVTVSCFVSSYLHSH
jgi:hypothetical protein